MSATCFLAKLSLNQIVADPELMPRNDLNESHCRDLADAYGDGGSVPEPTVFYDGDVYWLAAGFHRFRGAELAGLTELQCNVIHGTRQQARYHASGENVTNALHRSDVDKRKAVLMALESAPAGASDQIIADHCGVGVMLVRGVKLVRDKEKERQSQTATSTAAQRSVQPQPSASQSGTAQATPQEKINQKQQSGGAAAVAVHVQEQEQKVHEEAQRQGELARQAQTEKWQADVLRHLRSCVRLFHKMELPVDESDCQEILHRCERQWGVDKRQKSVPSRAG